MCFSSQTPLLQRMKTLFLQISAQKEWYYRIAEFHVVYMCYF